LYFCTLMIYMLLFQDVWQLLSFSCDTCEMLSLPQSSSLYFRLQAFDFSPSSFCNKMCFTICKVLLKFASLQNWFYVSFCFFASRFLFFICKAFGFCKVLCVVERCDLCKSCHLAIVATLSSYWCTSFLLFFFLFQGFFLVCWFIHCYKVMLLRNITCASIVTLSNSTCLCVFETKQITLWKRAL
jgi:hypothetical protein